MSRMRALMSELPRDAWTLLGADFVSAVGSGLTLPFLIVYLHQVRGLGLGEAGLALSTVALAGFAGNPLGGSLSDRVGARAALLGGLVVSAAGSASLGFVTSAWEVFGVVATLGLGAAVVWPSRDALRAALVPAAQRSTAYALAHGITNAGLGGGALLAALLVASHSAAAFRTLYLLDAASFLAVVPIVLRVPAVVTGTHASAAGSYRQILRDRPFLGLSALTALIVGAGFAQYGAAVPALATARGLDAHLLALCFAANTIAVIVFQLPVLSLLGECRRTTALAWACAVTGPPGRSC